MYGIMQNNMTVYSRGFDLITILYKGLLVPLNPCQYLTMGLLWFNTNPANIFGTLKGLNLYFWSQKTQTLSLTRDPPESQFLIVNTDSVD